MPQLEMMPRRRCPPTFEVRTELTRSPRQASQAMSGTMAKAERKNTISPVG
jgi:hypothetical protein